MQEVKAFLEYLHTFIGGHEWFVFLLLGAGLFFTLYLKFPQIRYFRHALRIVRGTYDRDTDVGDTTHFQALATALSGTVGTGNIAGVALAIHLGGPAGLFWMLVSAFLGMTTKFVEVTISHKYRDILPDGSVSGGPMYYMKKRLNIRFRNGKILKVGAVMGAFFAVATIFSSFGTGSLPQINSISNSMYTSFGLNHMITGAVLALLLGLVIVGGIKRIAAVTSRLVPAMAIIYFIGAMAVIISNYDNILPSLYSVFRYAFTGSAMTGGFLGATFAFVFNQGVTRGLFSNEAGQGSAPIAHSAAKAHEPVSEGMVAILEPFIDTIIICTLTGLVLLSSGAWETKYQNKFQTADMVILANAYDESNPDDAAKVFRHINNREKLPLFTGSLQVVEGQLVTGNITFLHARSFAEDIRFLRDGQAYSGQVPVASGVVKLEQGVSVEGRSLLHSAPLTTEAYKNSFLGNMGQYIVPIGLLMFAFSTAISWSYYGGRAVTYLFGQKYDIYYRLLYVVAFFFASFTDTTIVWALSYITIALMAIPNLVGILLLHREIKTTIREYWVDFKALFPEEKSAG